MPTPDAQSSREVAEASRETTWQGAAFLRELFLGRLRLDLVDPYPLEGERRPAFADFMDRLQTFLEERVDPRAIDESGEYPPEVIRGLADLGAFGMKIPTEYGGLGFTASEYVQAMKLIGSHDANVTALLSAHQAIGVPQPLLLFGTEAQKRRYLPRCAKGAISAFALTEPAVGSDPARLGTTARPDGEGGYVLDGEKLWTTNGTIAELIVVMARNPDTDRINAFVVEMDQPGVEVVHRCHFMGLKALANGVIRFRDVHLPADQRIGDEGAGLRIALTTLNTGRLSIPAALAGGAKRCLQLASRWAEAREQWGAPIGEHEAVTHMLSDIASTTFALEAVADLVGDFADREGYDIRLEAAAAKELNTTRFWHLVDQTLQVRGGRGYETARSLADRGEAPAEVERMMRDARINTIFEGSSEIMHLFMAREAVDRHLEVAGTLVDPKASRSDRLGALPGIAAHYAWWYPSRYFGWAQWPSYTDYGSLATHLRFANRSARRLARSIFHGMVAYRAGLERKQAFLFRAVDVALELFALVATVTRAKAIHDARRPDAEHAVALADAYALGARRRVDDLLRDLFDNDDEARYRTGRAVLDGEHRWLEAGIVGLPYSVEDLRPASVAQIRQAEAGGSAGGGRSGGDRRPEGRPADDRAAPEAR